MLPRTGENYLRIAQHCRVLAARTASGGSPFIRGQDCGVAPLVSMFGHHGRDTSAPTEVPLAARWWLTLLAE
jgi:hypothetical protein